MNSGGIGRSFKDLEDILQRSESNAEAEHRANKSNQAARRASTSDRFARADSSVPGPLYKIKNLLPTKQERKLVRLYGGFETEQEEKDADNGKWGCWQRAWLYPDLPWGAPPTWGKQRSIHRGVTFLKFWDVLLFVGLMYVAFSVPYQVGFNSANGRSQCVFSVRDTTGITFAVLDATADAIFTTDIILNFFQARWVVSSVGTPHWELVNDLPTIRTMYFRGSFVSDIIGQIPWQYMDCVFPEVDSGLKMLRLLRLMKLFRLHRIKRMIQALKRQFPTSELFVTAFELTLTMCIVAHWMCCLWFTVGFPDGWVYAEGITVLQPDGTYTAERTFHEWITSFYWAITTMSTIGYGDIVASTTTERAVAVVVMVLGCGLFAWATGRLTNILTKKSICSERFEEKMGELNEYLLNRGISERMVDKAKSYYMLKFPTLRLFDEEKILLDLPVELSKEMLVELYDDVIALSPLFGVFSKAVQKELCYRIKPKFVESGTLIAEEGAPATAMYIVRFGFVQIASKGEELMTAQRGDVFGENELVGLSMQRQRQRTARAVTVCDLCVITAEDWWELMRKYPEMGKLMTQMAKKVVRELEKKLDLGECLTTRELTCPNWAMASEYIEALMTSAAQRDMAAVNHTAGAHLPLRTWFTLDLTSIQFAKPQDVAKSKLFVVVTCRDEVGNVGAVGESRVFSATVGDGCTAWIRESVKVLLFHSHNRWAEIPPLHVTVYAAPRDRTFLDEQTGTFFNQFGDIDSPEVARQVRRASLQAIEDVTRTGSGKHRRHSEHAQPWYKGMHSLRSFSKRNPPPAKLPALVLGRSGTLTDKFEGCLVLWEGSLGLPHVIAKRDQQHTHSVELQPASAKSRWQPKNPVTVGLSVSVSRMLRSTSKWYTVLPALATKGTALGSAYFRRKREEMVRAMRHAVNHFGKVTTQVKHVHLMARHAAHHPALAEHRDFLKHRELQAHIDSAVSNAVGSITKTLTTPPRRRSSAPNANGDHRPATDKEEERTLEAVAEGQLGVRQDSGEAGHVAGSTFTAAKDAYGFEVMETFGQVVEKMLAHGGGAEEGEAESDGDYEGSEADNVLVRVVREQERQRRRQEEMAAAQQRMEGEVRELRKGMADVAGLLRTLVTESRAGRGEARPGAVQYSAARALKPPTPKAAAGGHHQGDNESTQREGDDESTQRFLGDGGVEESEAGCGGRAAGVELGLTNPLQVYEKDVAVEDRSGVATPPGLLQQKQMVVEASMVQRQTEESS